MSASASPFARADARLADAVAGGAFPCAVVEIGTSAGHVWRSAHGTLTGQAEDAAASLHTVFDLASLTKVLATTTLAMQLSDRGLLGLDQRMTDWIPRWRGADREDVTIRDLLAHASGLTTHLPLYETHEGRAAFVDAICEMPLKYVPRTQSLYSDLGFMLLAFVIEDAGGALLDAQFASISSLVAPARLMFRPPAALRPEIAPTGVDAWRRRLLVGEVHDGNAWALGGCAGHAGVFGDAVAVGHFAQLVLRGLGSHDDALARADTLREFTTRTTVPNSTRALGWDTMKPTSSCGTRMSPTAIGHTGFTGTSLWIDRERDFYVVLLTNRVHPTPANDAILDVRREFHDLVIESWDASLPTIHPSS